MGEVALFEDGGANVPAHIRAKFGAVSNDALSAGVSMGFPILSFKGKVWHVVQGKDKTLVTDPVSGDPKFSLEVVIVRANPHISKVFYEGGYVEGSVEPPTCFSHDGFEPAVGVAEKQATKCAVCPRNQWGSRVTESGAKGKECSDSRRLAVAPAGELANPMLLRIPAASLKDLSVYGDMLAKRNTPFQAIVTRIGFDTNVAYQKLIFTPLRWLTADEVDLVAETMEGPVVTSIIGDNSTGTGDEAGAGMEAMGGERPANVARVGAAEPITRSTKQLATAAEVEAALSGGTRAATQTFGKSEADKALADAVEAAMRASTEAPKPKAEPEVAPVAKTASQLKLEILKAEMAALEEAEASAAAPPAAEVVAPKRDHSKLLSEATASMDEVLGILDD